MLLKIFANDNLPEEHPDKSFQILSNIERINKVVYKNNDTLMMDLHVIFYSPSNQTEQIIPLSTFAHLLSDDGKLITHFSPYDIDLNLSMWAHKRRKAIDQEASDPLSHIVDISSTKSLFVADKNDLKVYVLEGQIETIEDVISYVEERYPDTTRIAIWYGHTLPSPKYPNVGETQYQRIPDVVYTKNRFEWGIEQL